VHLPAIGLHVEAQPKPKPKVHAQSHA
jgi:hypothetical protein